MTADVSAPNGSTADASSGHPRDPAAVPTHVAIIMDGNGRWARARGEPRLFGHRAGTENIRRVLRSFGQSGVRYVTIYAFSTENWERPDDEVSGLMRILLDVIGVEAQKLHKEGVRIRHIGRLDRLPDELRASIAEAVELTKHNSGLTLQVAFDYGGREEILNAVKRISVDHVAPDQITEEVFSSYLYTDDAPDPDLIVRTAGEMRLSNFLLWQAAYAEYYSTPALWPDFDQGEVAKALDAYRQRRRRFGRVDTPDASTR